MGRMKWSKVVAERKPRSKPEGINPSVLASLLQFFITHPSLVTAKKLWPYMMGECYVYSCNDYECPFRAKINKEACFLLDFEKGCLGYDWDDCPIDKNGLPAFILLCMESLARWKVAPKEVKRRLSVAAKEGKDRQ